MDRYTALPARARTAGDESQAKAARWRRPAFEVSRETYIRLQPAARNFLACTIRYFESAPTDRGAGASHDADEGRDDAPARPMKRTT